MNTLVSETEPLKRGRPPTYDPLVHPDELISLMEQGYIDVQIYAKWGISKDTFYTWRRTHPEFAEAHNIGMPKCEAVYVRKAQERLEAGDDAGFKYFIAIVNNKFGWGKEEGSKGNTYNITNMQVINSKEEYLRLVESVREQTQELNLIELKVQDESVRTDQDC